MKKVKKAFKLFFIYIGVLLLALLATVVFCGAFLFFYRDGDIFGIKYIKMNETLVARADSTMSDIQTIEVDSSNFDLYIKVSANVERVAGAMINKVYGYTHKSKAQSSFSLTYDNVSKTANFDSVQPSGWLSRKNSYMEIAIPESMADLGLNIVVKTEKADVVVGGSKDLKINNLTVESKKGDVTVTNVDFVGTITSVIGSGDFYIDEKCTTVNPISAIISVGSGVVNYSKVNPEHFNLSTVTISRIKRGKIGIIEADEVVTDGNIGGGGQLKIKQVARIDFSSLDTDVSISSIDNGSYMESKIVITGHGKVSIGYAKCDLEVNGHNGNIYVNQPLGNKTTLFSNQGDVQVKNAIKLVSATTKYGNINIEFDSNAPDYSEIVQNRAVKADTKNGHIIVKGLQNGNITASDRGRISLNYNKVIGENSIKANAGSVDIIVPESHALNLVVKSEVVSDIKVGLVGDLGDVDYQVNSNQSGQLVFSNIYGNAGINTLNVKSTVGKIKIRSQNIIGF